MSQEQSQSGRDRLQAELVRLQDEEVVADYVKRNSDKIDPGDLFKVLNNLEFNPTLPGAAYLEAKLEKAIDEKIRNIKPMADIVRRDEELEAAEAEKLGPYQILLNTLDADPDFLSHLSEAAEYMPEAGPTNRDAVTLIILITILQLIRSDLKEQADLLRATVLSPQEVDDIADQAEPFNINLWDHTSFEGKVDDSLLKKYVEVRDEIQEEAGLETKI